FNFKMIIIGDGPDRSELEKLVSKLNLEDKVIFKGNANYHDLVKYYSLSDIFVRPSLSEGLGNVFLEAMATGLPVIGTKVGGIPDFLEDRKTGLFCEVNNPKSIANKIKEVLENDQLRKTLIDNGLNLVREKYTWDSVAQKMENIFEKLQDRGPTSFCPNLNKGSAKRGLTSN
ncbi:glycosyltransferase family 4 protein, partial [Patescibacteria group bacterium]|nr:glycosyltransferase family 4 protein [Patescibacteria group bacterium]